MDNIISVNELCSKNKLDKLMTLILANKKTVCKNPTIVQAYVELYS